MDSLLDVLSADERMELIRCTTERRFRSGENVFHEGDLAGSLHIVTSGVFVAKVHHAAGQAVIVNEFPPGSVFGELSLLVPDTRRNAKVLAWYGGGTTRVLPRAELAALRHRPIGRTVERFLLTVLAVRNQRLTSHLVELLFTATPRRVERHLLRLGEPAFPDVGDGWHRMSQDDLAEFTATTRATANRALRDLERRQVIELGRGRIRIVDRAALERLAR